MIAALLLAAARPCAAARPAECRDTNELAWAADFMPMLRRFFGRTPPAPLLYRGGTLVGQAADVLGGPPDAPTRIGAFHRFTACRAHSCMEKGALVVSPKGRPVAVAILHSACAEVRVPPDCSAIDLVDIYVRGDRAAIVADLQRWASATVAAQTINRAPPTIRVVRLA